MKFAVNVLGKWHTAVSFLELERLVGKMSVDRLSNMLSSIKNSKTSGRLFVEVYHTKECEGVAQVLRDEGFLSEVRIFKPKHTGYKMMRLNFTDDSNGKEITDVKRISKPGRRSYTTAGKIKPVVGGRGVLVVSTSKGIMSGLMAKKRKLGGELICKVY